MVEDKYLFPLVVGGSFIGGAAIAPTSLGKGLGVTLSEISKGAKIMTLGTFKSIVNDAMETNKKLQYESEVGKARARAVSRNLIQVGRMNREQGRKMWKTGKDLQKGATSLARAYSRVDQDKLIKLIQKTNMFNINDLFMNYIIMKHVQTPENKNLFVKHMYGGQLYIFRKKWEKALKEVIFEKIKTATIDDINDCITNNKHLNNAILSGVLDKLEYESPKKFNKDINDVLYKSKEIPWIFTDTGRDILKAKGFFNREYIKSQIGIAFYNFECGVCILDMESKDFCKTCRQVQNIIKSL